MPKNSYVLLTACKNEADYIEACLRSVVKQTVLPAVWVIVDDGSSDGTIPLVEKYSEKYSFIRLVKLPARKNRSFGAQYRAIQRGQIELESLAYNYLGVLDADIALESESYFARLLEEFSVNEKLGIAGGVVCEKEADGEFRERRYNVPWSVPGGVQMFRRECFEEVGGYVPLEYGGSDTLAEIVARMKGWNTYSVSGLRVLHYRPTSTADGKLRGVFRLGMLDGSFASHPFFMILKCIRRIASSPTGALILFAGYTYYRLARRDILIPSEAVQFLRDEQMSRVKALFRLRHRTPSSANPLRWA